MEGKAQVTRPRDRRAPTGSETVVFSSALVLPPSAS
jgi:hypothetical protein